MIPTGLPDLPKPTRDLNLSVKPEFLNPIFIYNFLNFVDVKMYVIYTVLTPQFKVYGICKLKTHIQRSFLILLISNSARFFRVGTGTSGPGEAVFAIRFNGQPGF